MATARFTTEVATPEAIVTALADGGVRFVLGMPGGLTGPIWRALYKHQRIRAVQCREESIASLMAEAYGRATGEPVVVMGQGEWIVGNAGQGYLEALLGSAPLVVLTEMSDAGAASHHAPYQCGTGDYGTWDARTALAGMSKRVMVSYNPTQAVQHTQLALKHATTGDPGPVAVVFASTALRGSVGPSTSPTIYPTERYLRGRDRAVDQGALGEAVAAIDGAARPVILAGNGVRLARARDEVAALAEVVDAPVATTAGGKGVFSEHDPRAAGVVGRYGWPSANRIVAASDVIVAVGTKLAPHDAQGIVDPSRQKIIQVDSEPLNAAWTHPVDIQLVGDAGVYLRALTKASGGAGGARRAEPAAARIRAATESGEPQQLPPVAQEPGLIDPRVTIDALGRSLASDAIVTCDAGENRLFMMRWFQNPRGGEYLQPAAGGGMGYAVPAAMGAKLAHPARCAVAVCGDGGFAMSIHALMTAVQERLPVGVVVLNNQALGWVLHGMGEKTVAAEFASFDHAAIARSIGCDGARVSSAEELRDALKCLDGLTVPFVIDVPTSLNVSFRDIEQTL